MPLFFYGLAFFVVGLMITVATYAAASGGGRYILSYGPMAVGLVAMARGITHVVRDRNVGGSHPGAAAYPGFAVGGDAQPGGAFQQPRGAAQPWAWPAGSDGGAASVARNPGFGGAGSGSVAPAQGPAAPPGAALPMANWYPDPQDTSQLRWWDGQAWTGQTQPRS